MPFNATIFSRRANTSVAQVIKNQPFNSWFSGPPYEVHGGFPPCFYLGFCLAGVKPAMFMGL